VTATPTVGIEHVDVLVVGAGPAGTTVAAALAGTGRRVVVIDRSLTPGDRACGELLTPRALRALADAGVTGDQLAGFQAITHVRLTTRQHSGSTPWPTHPRYGDRAAVAPRDRLDALLGEHAIAAGATILRGHEATAPIVERGFVRGAHVTRHDATPIEMRAAFTVVADGADSRFGRALGTYRQPTWPSARAHRAMYRSALHEAAEIELVLDLADRAGTPITGYGWMFPRGDGTVNVGVLIMSTSPSFQVINPAHVLDQLVTDNAGRWHLADQPERPPAGGRIPLGGSVGPCAGPTYLVVGDAAGVANPLSGAGVEYAVESGALAARVLDEALRTGNSAALQRYQQLLSDRYGAYFKVGRLGDRLLGRPSVARRVGRLASSRPRIADSFVRFASNEMRPGRGGTTELAYRAARAVSTFAPDA
jgi:geranylgeranyl reductase family protein